MKKDIWLKPGKELNTGAIIGGIGFAIYIALSALEWRGLALLAALAGKEKMLIAIMATKNIFKNLKDFFI